MKAVRKASDMPCMRINSSTKAAIAKAADAVATISLQQAQRNLKHAVVLNYDCTQNHNS